MSNRYRPTVVKESGSKGDSGVADLTWGEKKLVVAFEDGETYKILREELPEYCQEWDFVDNAFVVMTGKNDAVLGIRPMQGVFQVKFNQFATKNEDTPPAPQTKSGQYGPYQYFIALFEVTKGKYTGAIYPTFFNYNFIDMEDVVAIRGEGASSARLMDFLDVAGAWEEGEMEYSDNILPALQKRLKHAKKTFQIVVKKGYVESTMDADFESDDEPTPKKKVVVDEEDDDVPAPKKKVVKKPADDDDEL